jgi:hypothetical protein
MARLRISSSRQSFATLAVTVSTLTFLCSGVASAETTLLAEWLINGAPVATLTAVEGTGEGIMEDTARMISIKCSAIGIGSVGPDGEGELTEILNLEKIKISETTPLLCQGVKGCEASSTDIEVFPKNLPYLGVLFLDESGSFLTKMTDGLATFKITCLVLGLKVSEECSSEKVIYEVLNVAGGVEAMGEGLPRGNCTLGGEATERLEALPGNLLKPTAGGTLSMSSE